MTNHFIKGGGFPYLAMQVNVAISPALAVTLPPGSITAPAYSICGLFGLTGKVKNYFKFNLNTIH